MTEIINELQKRLDNYAAKPEANKYYLARQQAVIDQLNTYHDNFKKELEELEAQQLWYTRTMQKLVLFTSFYGIDVRMIDFIDYDELHHWAVIKRMQLPAITEEMRQRVAGMHMATMTSDRKKEYQDFIEWLSFKKLRFEVELLLTNKQVK